MGNPKVKRAFAELVRDWKSIADEAEIATRQGLRSILKAATDTDIDIDDCSDDGYSVTDTEPKVKEDADGGVKKP